MIPALVAALLAAAAPADTVFTADGGRVSGTVLEDSPTTGVTIQTADGAVRRIDRGEVARIEFADGSVSTPRPQPAAPPAPAPALQPVLAKSAPAADGAVDTVYFRGGGRARGTVMEEGGAAIKVRLLDGAIRSYGVDEIVRIEYADGSASTPRAAPPAPLPASVSAVAAAPRARSAEVGGDTVYFLAGGRVRGTVIEENPKTGVKVRLLDGTVQTYSRDDLVRIEYADGSVSRRVTPASATVPAPARVPAPPPVAPPAPVYSPPAPVYPPPAPAYPPPARVTTAERHVFPLYLSLGVGATFLGGDVASTRPMSELFATEQANLSSELGLRLSPSFALGVYADVSGGDTTASVRARPECSTMGVDCMSAMAHVGFLARHTWDPLTSRPKWMSIGTGWEVGSVGLDRHDGSGASEVFTYSGREYVRVGAGVDFRSNDVLALGFYGSFAVGEYTEYKDPTSTSVSVDRATHTTTQVGLRLTLFP